MAGINSKPMVPPTTAPTTMTVLDFFAASGVINPEVLVDGRTMDVLTDVPIVITTAEDVVDDEGSVCVTVTDGEPPKVVGLAELEELVEVGSSEVTTA